MAAENQEQSSVFDDIIEENVFYKTFFGKDQEYYEERYMRIKNGDKFIFNPYAFFLGAFWLSYRKMYIELLVVVAATIIIDLILAFVLHIENSSLDRLLNMVSAGIIGISANYFYIKKGERAINKAQEMYANTSEQLDYLEKEGGVSILAPIIVGIIIIVMIAAIIFLGDYSDTMYY